MLVRHEMPPIPAGALATLVNPYGSVTVTLGQIDYAPDGLLFNDPLVPAGTACVVLQRHIDEQITSSLAYRVLLDVGNGPQVFWVYADELREVTLANEEDVEIL